VRIKILGIAIISACAINSAVAASQNVNMNASVSVASSVTVNGFNQVSNSTLAALASPTALTQGNIVDTTSLQSFTVYSDSGAPITVNASNNAGGNGQSPTSPAVLTTTSNATPIPYQINYTPCGSGAVAIDLTTCTGTSGCSIPAANANPVTCASNPGSGNYTFIATNTNKELEAGSYIGGTGLTFSSGL
jgi:hypothetical protein